MIGAIGPDGPWAYYLTVGMVATVNPCGFAMLPAYLSYFLGLEDDDAAVPRASLAEAVRVSLAVSLGFLAVFATAGTLVELTSLPVYSNAPWISVVIGVALLALGVAMLSGVEVNARLPRLDKGGRDRTVGSMFLFGVSYAIASIGCALPLFLGAVAGTMSRESVVDGTIGFALYALGMTLVLVTLTVAIALARTSIVRVVRRAQPYVSRVAGGLVALAGAYVAYWGWLELRISRSGAGELPSSSITDRVVGWSDDLTRWVEDVGSVRIGVIVIMLLAAVAVAVRLGRPGRPATGAGAGNGDDDAEGDDAGYQGASRSIRQPVANDRSRP
ncbi:MAG TPA: cytochrome c biogenesis CcdA family protein [Acidimicrobiales bacterium]|nr:cytochrome c biogenesis CcdA family protein [Acidimicrobiales bacterium]